MKPLLFLDINLRFRRPVNNIEWFRSLNVGKNIILFNKINAILCQGFTSNWSGLKFVAILSELLQKYFCSSCSLLGILQDNFIWIFQILIYLITFFALFARKSLRVNKDKILNCFLSHVELYLEFLIREYKPYLNNSRRIFR